MRSRPGDGGPLCVRVHVGEDEYGEKNDFGSAVAGVSSESESVGVIVGGGGGEVNDCDAWLMPKDNGADA
jgi:hypothetical protein